MAEFASEDTSAGEYSDVIVEEFDGEDNEEDYQEEEEEENEYHPLTSPITSFPKLEDAIKYDQDKSNFDLLYYLYLDNCKSEGGYDEGAFFEKGIVLINKCRHFVMKLEGEQSDILIGEKLNEYIRSEIESSNNDDDDGQYFRPVLEDDAFLMNLDELLILLQQRKEKYVSENNSSANENKIEKDSTKEMSNKINILEMKLAAMQGHLDLARSTVQRLTNSQTTADDGDDGEKSRKLNNDKGKKKHVDSDYFSSYSHYSIHETMLQDKVRTEAYEKGILSKDLFKDKIVMDVGCGTGILSMFAAKAGAKKVYAIDGSANIANKAKLIVIENGFQDIIQVIHTKVEEFTFPRNEEEEKVDIIISEWMGYALLFESMLPSVLYARDNFLKPGGKVYPEVAKMYIEGASDNRLSYWDDVYGFQMNSMKSKIEEELTTETSVEIVDKNSIVTDRYELIEFDINKVQDHELDFQIDFVLHQKLPSSTSASTSVECKKLNKFVISFDVDFVDANVSFTTGCQNTPTHWKQASLWLDSLVAPSLSKDNDEAILAKGSFKMGRNKDNEREMDFHVLWDADTSNGSIKSSISTS